MNSKYKITNKLSNESLHSLLDHESLNSPTGSNSLIAEHEKMWLTTKEASAVSAEDVLSRLRVNFRSGLPWKECEFRRQITGYNEFSVHQGDPLWKKYIEQFRNPLILLLLASAVVSVFMRQFDDAFSITTGNSLL